MKFMVVGGAGYIGSHFVRHLKDHEVLVYDNLSTGHRAHIPADVTFVEGDILDTELVLKTINDFNPESIIHFAALALVGESVREPLKYYRNNVQGTLSILQAIENSGKMIPLVFSSSCAVYGEPKSLPIHELEKKGPLSPYGQTKLICERMIRDFCDAHPDARAYCLRYFNACGAEEDGSFGEDHNPETHLIPNAIRAALNAEELKIFGQDFPTPDGTCVRDYIHVEDLARAHLSAALKMSRKEGPNFAAINLGTGRGYSVLEVVEEIEKQIGEDIKKQVTPRREGDPAALYSDVSNSSELLEFETEHSDLSNIIQSALKWHRKQLSN